MTFLIDFSFSHTTSVLHLTSFSVVIFTDAIRRSKPPSSSASLLTAVLTVPMMQQLFVALNLSLSKTVTIKLTTSMENPTRL
jgi:hypothetical protein